VANDDLLVLDSHTRLQIAKDLGLECGYVTTKDMEDHYAEKRILLRPTWTSGI
jgi:hypothetical protein